LSARRRVGDVQRAQRRPTKRPPLRAWAIVDDGAEEPDGEAPADPIEAPLDERSRAEVDLTSAEPSTRCACTFDLERACAAAERRTRRCRCESHRSERGDVSAKAGHMVEVTCDCVVS